VTPHFANFDPKLKGTWVHPGLTFGFNLSRERPMRCGVGRFKVIYAYTPVYEHPTYFQQLDGTCIAAGEFDLTDQGSVPIPFQRWIPKDGSHGFYLHDFIYKHGGAFFRYRGETAWTFRRVTRAQADMLLRVSAQCDPVLPVGAFRAWWVWMGVCVARPFTPGLFHGEWRPLKEVPQWPVEERPEPEDIGGYGGGDQ